MTSLTAASLERLIEREQLPATIAQTIAVTPAAGMVRVSFRTRTYWVAGERTTTAASVSSARLIIASGTAAARALPPTRGGAGPLDLVSMTLSAAAFALLVSAGLLSSVGHLGKPLRAWRAFSQWRSSWLSREGVAALNFRAAEVPSPSAPATWPSTPPRTSPISRSPEPPPSTSRRSRWELRFHRTIRPSTKPSHRSLS